MTMIDFPDINKVYISEELWPFLASRIPRPAQPVVLLEIRRRNIDVDNEVSLLNVFDKRTITNPFLLELA